MIKAVVTGAAGRMGGKIISLISTMENIEVVGAVEIAGHPIVGRDIGQGLGKKGLIVCNNLSDCIDLADVVIDFTNHEASMNYLKVAGEKNRAIVVGSTGKRCLKTSVAY